VYALDGEAWGSRVQKLQNGVTTVVAGGNGHGSALNQFDSLQFHVMESYKDGKVMWALTRLAVFGQDEQHWCGFTSIKFQEKSCTCLCWYCVNKLDDDRIDEYISRACDV
jgi:hypothetical protein